MKNSFSQKRIPTLLGLGVLVAGLVVGILFLGQGFGAFSPRATAQTTPKNIEVTNVTDTGFTVSFLTDDSTPGFMRYGTDATNLNLQVSDDRDQISGTVSPYTSHYITIRELQPNTPYYFTLGTGSQAKFDNNGQPFTTKTAARNGNPSPALTIYGSVLSAQSQPASGSIVYASIDGVGELSSLVKDSGSWSIPLSNARTADGSSYATIDSSAAITLLVQGPDVSTTSNLSTTVAQAQPVPTITLGTNSAAAPATDANSTDQAANTTGSGTTATDSAVASSEIATVPSSADIASPSPSDIVVATQNPLPSADASSSAVSDTTSVSPSPSAIPVSSPQSSPAPSRVVNLQSETKQTVTTTQPVIQGEAPANVKITIQIHSSTAITSQVQADDTGSYSLDLSQLAQNLEPGTHTVTISYTDPQTGQTVTQQKTFVVAPTASSSPAAQSTADQSSTTGSSQLLAQADPSSTLQPYGTTNPFPVTDVTPTPTPISSDSSETRVAVSASGSAIPVTGSTGTTFAVVGAGLFLLLAGSWSFVASRHQTTSEEQDD